jgi:hypothetical protein
MPAVLQLLLALFWGTCAAWAQQTVTAPSRVHISVEGDWSRYTMDGQKATVRGDARIKVTSPQMGEQSAELRAEELQADFVQHRFSADKGGRILAGPALIAGDKFTYDGARGELLMDRAQGYVALAPSPENPNQPGPTAYFSGRRVVQTGRMAYLYGGRFTTCDRDDPHYYIGAKRIKYDTTDGKLTVNNAKLHLYGLSIPIAPWASTGLGGTTRQGGLPFGTPGYSSREGLYVPLSHSFSGPQADWALQADLMATRRLGVTGTAYAERKTDDWELKAQVTRKEAVTDRLEDRLGVSRYPEISYTRHVTPPGDGQAALSFNLSLGDYEEDLETPDKDTPPRPRVKEQRVLGAFTYVGNATQFQARRGDWYGLAGRLSHYSSGDTYGDLEAFLGAGFNLGWRVQAHATLRHHFISGETPFLFDDVDIKTELTGGATFGISDKWSFSGWGRYDLDKHDVRDYELSADLRQHCLTWGIYYRAVGDRVGLRVNLNGLTGGTRGFEAKSSLQAKMESEGLFIKPIALVKPSAAPQESSRE